MLLPPPTIFITHRTSARPTIILADFEQPTYRDWVVSENAFGKGPAKGTLENQRIVTGYTGKGLVDSFLGGDDATGSLTSPSFVIKRHYINFQIGGGYRPGEAGISLIVNGKVVRSSTGNSRTYLDTEQLTWKSWKTSDLEGMTGYIEIYDNAKGSWGHINVDEIEEGDAAKEVPMIKQKLYHESYRPQFHFSAKNNWLNDPNGLVYFEGKYHLFFQYNPKSVNDGFKNWGHAESTDLIHWKELPVAISPDAMGDVWSGSAAVDIKNTSGLGNGKIPPLVAMYTASGNPFTQCLVYSPDAGVTWNKYEKNPVVGNIIGEDRDPRIFWYEPIKCWVMALYLDEDRFAILNSPDLKKWTKESEIAVPGSAECPDLYEMPIQDQPSKSKWIFYGANFRYLIGTFDGKVFHPESGPFINDYSDTFYASQTWNNAPHGRRIQIAWMRGPGPLPGAPFNQQMNFPSELELKETPDGLRIFRLPVKEISKLHRNEVTGENLGIAEANKVLSKLKNDCLDISFSIRMPETGVTKLNIRGTDLIINAETKEISILGTSAPIKLDEKLLNLRILLDRSSIEVFANEGLVSITKNFEPDLSVHGIRLTQSQGECKVQLVRGYEVASVWQ